VAEECGVAGSAESLELLVRRGCAEAGAVVAAAAGFLPAPSSVCQSNRSILPALAVWANCGLPLRLGPAARAQNALPPTLALD
jgi:hypothetical protein